MDYTPEKGFEIDHIDGNALNNLRSNLRMVRRIDNIHNVQVRKDNKTTGIRGISYETRWNSYTVDFNYNKQRLYFKTFKILPEAVYIRYLCEVTFLKEFRNTLNDKKILELINELSEQQKVELEEYFWERVAKSTLIKSK